ncbi:beta-L-arabinofuranosidase domain-containing protein [Thermoanaerobacterium sp. R66]|uniref:glycoside hydrolase family 127 protein n=1 Tax=Thermoanaerobacterium sp. R66 TaxID=2742479 RepID=UPI0023805783|nr:beta-L-arabinofuranosidase domain-containing protein [Thermoanaerobacterium sp. R66]MDE4541148.1 glycoside hydrolase family 127 protein [Thermoanaerobacterium sp. R66]
MINNQNFISLKQISINKGFWSYYIKLIKDAMIPYQWEALNDRVPNAEPSHVIKNFKIAAGEIQGEFAGMVFQDSDLYKWLEAVSYSLIVFPDTELEKTADEVIDLIAKVQQSDGYLNTYFTIKEPDKKWTNLRDCHELYCAGHLIEAAVAYYEATGKKKLLDVACRFADHIDSVFGPEPNKKKGYPGHEEIELALIKLYRVTNNVKYLNLSKYFIDERGKRPLYFEIEAKERGNTNFFDLWDKLGPKYFQVHLPVKEQTTAEGHAVRAVYLYSGMADVALETGDQCLIDACKRLWDNLTKKRMYITGSIGSMSIGESLTFDYDLPNDTNYSETCASVGLVFFAYRMLQIDADRQYSDVMERALYNTVISGMSLDGKKFFYVNPLEVWPEACEKNKVKSHVKYTRQPWFGCACCPPNIARLLTSLGKYIYSKKDKEVFAHLYVDSELKEKISESQVSIKQSTQYPWDEKIDIEVVCEKETEFTLSLRIPGWCKEAKIKVNNEEIDLNNVMIKGYAKINRIWKHDKVEVYLSMPVMRIKANPNVREDEGKVAIQRGPIVYCLEEVDNGKNLNNIVLPTDSKFEIKKDKDLNDVCVIETDAFREKYDDWNDELYKSDVKVSYEKTRIRFVPYFVWANRTPGEMEVWVRE